MLVLPSNTVKVFYKFIKENKVLVHKYIFRQVKKGLEQNLETVHLFEFEDSGESAWVPKANYLMSLQEALRIFVKSEEYELAAQVTEVINTYYIDQLLKNTTQE